MPWVDNKIEPEHKLFAQDKELTLVILSSFAQPPINPDLQVAEMELPDKLAQFFRKRCQENNHKIKIVSYADVQNYRIKQGAIGPLTPLDTGKHFKADYVLDLTINNFSLYEKKAVDKLFRGEVEVSINLYKVDVKDGNNLVFNKVFNTEGTRSPMDAGNVSAAALRGLLLTKVSRDISKMFIAYPPEERMAFDHATGLNAR
jgi:hypothetical protein